MAVFEEGNLCKGWTPRGTERISLIHNELDGCVPYANATKFVLVASHYLELEKPWFDLSNINL